MRNLKLISSCITENNILKGAECFCVGAKIDDFTEVSEKKEFNDVLFVYCNHCLYHLEDNGKTCNELYNFETYYSTTQNVNYTSVNIEYNHINDSIIVALQNGDIFSFELQTKTVDCIGSVDGGLKSIGFSPDLEVLVIATGNNTLILMDGLFNPIGEVSLNSAEPVEKQMVNVGWGKKETQFHGSEGKAARITKTIHVNLDVEDDHRVRITWREDSSLFAVSFWCPVENTRKIKIYNNVGKLQCNSESLPGLEQSISWRPSGNLIAFGQTLPNKHVIAFLEKNGLRHGEFILPPNLHIKEISWNINSTIMCLVCEKRVQLWMMNNYHWYLKQEIHFTTDIIHTKWHPEHKYELILLLSDGSFHTYSWIVTVDRSVGAEEKDRACVAVIDGNKILLTCFKQGIIPPPMATYTLNFNCAVNCVGFLQTTTKTQETSENQWKSTTNDFIVLLSDNTFSMVVVGVSTSPTAHPICVSTKFPQTSCLRHLLWTSPNTVLLCVDQPHTPQELYKFNLKQFDLNLMKQIPLEFNVHTICSTSSKPDNVVVQGGGGSVYNSSLTNDFEYNVVVEGLEHLCDEMGICEGKKREDTVVTLDSWYHLYCQGELVSSKATSFFIQTPYLIYTTDEHELVVHRIVETCRKISTRRLERGARIVTVFNDTVVLQLPRGNLETIQPRALVLDTVSSLLEKLDYREAFALMRRQRIHLNLFVDHHPQVFLMTAAKFIQRINDPNHLNIFLSELNDKEDVTRSIYKDFYDQEKRPPVLNRKLQTVCSALREAMLSEGGGEPTEKYLLPILTTHVRVDEMSEALKMAATSEQALRHLIFLADIDKLYDKAISLYEVDLALKIAGESKKDPKEYIPYLNSLKNLDPTFMRFAIDCQYKNYESALRNISKSADSAHFEDALDLIQRTAQYPLALDLYHADLQRYKIIAERYAEYLVECRGYEEAALMFSRCDDLERALTCYAKCGLWRNAVTMARKLHYSTDKLKQLGEQLFSGLVSQELWEDAADLARDVLDDDERAIECLCEAKLWNKAYYLLNKQQDNQYPVSRLLDGLTSSANATLANLEHELGELERFASRLTQVRAKKAERALMQLSNDIDINDLQSEISSSTSSSWSSRSSG
ncbi:elongator complex protein 1 [Nilaparvata lugens]|uniref:elongator complex protein 1 n=1 Tax=Nilaparvata lugens TaxID=108931 RepID=UPI00193E736B|nr:elongator complex protein 1 [Nilaparvata lugens]